VFYEFEHFDFTQSITAEHWQLRAVCKVGQHLAIPAAGKASRDTQFEGHWLLPHGYRMPIVIMQNPSVKLHMDRFSLVNTEPPHSPISYTDFFFRHRLKSIILQ